MSIKVSGYNFFRARSIPALIRQVNRYNKLSDVHYRYNFVDGNDGFFYAIYFGKMEAKISKPEKGKPVEASIKDLIDV